MEKNYKDYEKQYIGSSDIACLILSGYQKETDAFATIPLHFGADGSYDAYIVDEDAIIGKHYEKIAEFEDWLKIYDDNGLTKRFDGRRIIIYRAARMGCIIQIV